jgi:predicted pyridoxine 5'-phosphate oxidase superfamily flavin-nucleotide-binding protein
MDGIFPIKPQSPWHEGELTLQRSAGVLDKMAAVGLRNIRHHLIQQHREFYPLLPFIVMGAVGLNGEAWATLLSGRPGFISSPDDKTLCIDARVDPSDPAALGTEDGNAVGLLGMQLETRRRNRANGTIRRSSADRFDVAVEDSFGNCPRYITIRKHSFAREPDAPFESRREDADHLDPRARRMIESADTLFVASYLDRDDGRRQVDVSHRGGKAGFVNIDADGILSIPDFNGNRFFNTLGNILTNPKCGLLFVDFETGDMLQMTGMGSVVLDGPETKAFQGAERLLRFRPLRTVYRANAFPLRFASDASGISPSVQLTGNWEETAARLKADQLKMKLDL